MKKNQEPRAKRVRVKAPKDKQVKAKKVKEEMKEKKIFKWTRKRLVTLVMIVLLLAGVVVGVTYYFLFSYNTKQNQTLSMGMNDFTAENMVTATGVTSIGMTSDDFEVQNLTAELYIEEVYISTNSEIDEGTPILKIADESITEARKELESELQKASLAYRAGAIEYEQSKITTKYDYDTAVVSGTQAEEIYNSTISSLADKVTKATEALEDSNALITEYEEALANDTYKTEYPYEELKALYDENLKLLTDKMSEWGITWEQVTGGSNAGGGVGGSGSGTTEASILKNLYSILEQNLKDYEEAEENYTTAVEDATIQLEKEKLGLAALQSALLTAKKQQEEGIISAKLTYQTALEKADQAEKDYETALQKAQSTYEELEDAKKDAQENLDIFESSIGDGYFYASSNGTVVMSAYRAGGYLLSDSMVVAYSNQEEVTVTVSVDQDDISKLSVGDTAMVQISNVSESYNGVITAINPVSASSSRSLVTYTVTVELEGDVSDISANQTATVIFGMGGAQSE